MLNKNLGLFWLFSMSFADLLLHSIQLQFYRVQLQCILTCAQRQRHNRHDVTEQAANSHAFSVRVMQLTQFSRSHAAPPYFHADSCSTEAADNSIKPDQTNVFSTEGSNISLSCTYTGSVNSLHWYRHKPGSRPEFLLMILEASKTVTPAQPPPRLSIKLNNDQDKKSKKVDLIISSAAVSDSALYYCALRPTVKGNPAALYKNSHSFVILKVVLSVL
ncbi:uncharacterized protein LOC113633899 [Tachysurus fulvidraco]|uniref:uncharacterized protein LOC113633899 n=1 Tax=Tachysurus fulvidraco TaxID=1234273 RepID=UPI001FEF98D0|nr:uncharacterized protein LOC113633899 [Tachysurus fulvidraco]